MIVLLLHILPPGQALWPLWAWRAPQLFPWTKAEALGRARQLLPLPPFDQNLDSAPSRQESQFPPSQQQLCWEAAKTFKIKSVSPSIWYLKTLWSQLVGNDLEAARCRQPRCWLPTARRDWISAGGLLWRCTDGQRTPNRRLAGVSSVQGVWWWCRTDSEHQQGRCFHLCSGPVASGSLWCSYLGVTVV